MFIAWYWMVLIALVAIGYYCHMKRYCRAFRQDRDALLEARNKLFHRTSEEAGTVREHE
ncbi:hypothetical protein NFJ76_03265 [Citrobacter freundii]|uniref:hypothetical protein n=1 Tax=Citrobacter freundii TaxID=546 RepID=UPI00242F42EB|nr:hypothetical protein [Citrobacter freundii]WFW61024.1 hypothetical protein NFJ76_03265 [Citrobacter freundii]